MKLSKEEMERIVKCAIIANKNLLEFNKKFLELYDNTELIVEDKGDHFMLTTKMIKEKPKGSN